MSESCPAYNKKAPLVAGLDFKSEADLLPAASRPKRRQTGETENHHAGRFRNCSNAQIVEILIVSSVVGSQSEAGSVKG